MPNKKSAKKELRKNVKRHAANLKVAGKAKRLLKANLKKVSAKDKGVAAELPQTMKALDKAAKKGVISRNKASRQKSRLMKKINLIK